MGEITNGPKVPPFGRTRPISSYPNPSLMPFISSSQISPFSPLSCPYDLGFRQTLIKGFGGSGFIAMNSVMKKRRTSRRPRTDMQFLVERRDTSSHSSTPSLDNGSKLSPNQNLGYDSSLHRKEFDSRGCSSRIATGYNNEGMAISRKIHKEDRKHGELSGFHGDGILRDGTGSDPMRCSEGVLAPANWKSSSTAQDDLAHRSDDGHRSGYLAGGNNGSADNKLKKVRLKVRIHPKSNSENPDSSLHNLQSSDAPRHGKSNIEGNLDDYHTCGANDFCYKLVESSSEKQTSLSDPVRKSNRIPKRRVLDGAFNEGDDYELHYLEKLKPSKFGTVCNPQCKGDGEGSLQKKNTSKVSKSKKLRYDVDEDYGLSRSTKEARKKSRAEREFDGVDYVEEDAHGPDDGLDPTKRKQQKEVDRLTDVRMEVLTTRQRALQSTGESLIEFPNGLPPAPSRKQKEKLSEEEKLAKKAEIAQRRKLQAEKAAKESEAEAIRKILGQDSNRKKKEEKMRKERDVMAQKKAEESLTLASNSIRWVMGPAGTIVTFGEGVGLPSILGTKTSSYPPPREKCAAPLCTNSYKYRDSKLNLPLCSLQCYKAVRENSETISSC